MSETERKAELEKMFAEANEPINYGFGKLQIPDGGRDDETAADRLYNDDGIEKIEEA